MKFFIILCIIILFIFEILFFENIFDKIELLYTRTSIYISIYYVLVSSLAFLTIASLFFVKKNIYFFIFIFILFFAYTLELTYRNINHTGFTLSDLSIAVNELNSFAYDAFLTYGESIKSALFIVIIWFVLIVVIRRLILKYRLFISLRRILFLFLMTIIFSYSITYKTTGETLIRPSPIKLLNTGLYYYLNKIYYGPREKLLEKPINQSKYKNIIFIMDESIGGEYLSINGYAKKTTPYLESIANKYINLGLASSAANCSARSNLILMSGIGLSELPDKKHDSLKRATLFQYAKNAGYKTHYLLNQSFNKPLQNYLTKYDLEYMDNFIKPNKAYENKTMPEEDIVLETVKALNSSEKNFIFMVKHGSHFSWENSYPKDEKYFLPTLKDAEALSLERKEEALNSYLNSIRYNVDLFFTAFLNKIEFFERNDTIIIYTSDHGQSILEKGRVSTHCDSVNPPLSQGIVPLLIFPPKEDRLFKNRHLRKDVHSHFQIFPTLIEMMGYKNKNLQTLFTEMQDGDIQQEFISGDIFGRVMLQKNDIRKR